MTEPTLERAVWQGTIALIYLFLFAPLIVVAVSSINPDGLTFPPTGFTLEWYASMLQDSDLLSATFMSVLVAAVTTLLSLPLVVLMGLALRDDDFTGGSFIENFFVSPLSTPQIILGIALLIYFVSFGLVGSVAGLIFAHLVITIPYAFRTVLASLKQFDEKMEEAARNLGASRFETLRFVTLPVIRPAIVAGGGFAFVMSFTNFTISLFLVGPDTTTLPIQLYQYITFSIDPTVSAVATVLSVFSFLIVYALDRTFGVQQFSQF